MRRVLLLVFAPAGLATLSYVLLGFALRGTIPSLLLFSLYHLWLPLSNVFRIVAFLPAYYVTWRMQNLYIAMVFHCLSNLVSVVAFVATVNRVG